MDTVYLILIVAVLVSVMVTAFVSYLLYQRSLRKSEDRIRRYEAERDDLRVQVTALTAEKAGALSALKEKEAYVERLSAEYDKFRHDQEISRQKDLETMKDTFKALAAENSDTFKVKSEKTIGELLKPVQEKFREFSESVKESREKSLERHTRLEQQIKDLNERSRMVGDEARNLADALSGRSKVQGDFGEMLLTDVLKNAGLVEGIHFLTQHVITDSAGREVKSVEGKTLIPDVLVLYPDDTVVVVDSKVSLTAYSQYVNAATAEERSRLAKAHALSVRRHVDELKSKDYASYVPEGRRKVDYNIMFIPIEGAFRLMLEEDPALWQLAKDNNVLIVSQMTLVIVLNMIRMSWKQYDQEKNIADVYKTAEELMTQLKSWMDNFVTLGDALGKASKAYEDSKRKLSDSNQSVIKKIEKLEKLGLSPKRSKAALKSGARLSSPDSVIPRQLDAEPKAID